MTKGAYKYLPKEMIEELNKLKIGLKIDRDSDAFKRMVEDAKIGRQVRFTIDFNVNNKRK